MPKRKSSWSKVALPPSAALTQEVWHEHHSRGILEIFAVSQGIVGIRGVFSNKFLAMSKKGKLHASARFTVDCHFRERFQENSYNTYASAVHRSPRSGRPWYVALNKRGKAKRGCSPRARPQHVSTHFLPRFWQPQPPELAFTVALPEKKPPLPKPKVAPSPPRRSPGKYRLKFRFG
ncbi:fibroblast growth factor 5 isoform X3 [Passer montanus]|uniref:fibroblast growth factor 5 isoform X3 n=1 Tax=Passer montanus TaxID=9160 RepID=UPI00196051B4|nr:fibroblast growth factor 5 isoform X3 [Passer montanus]